MPRYQIEYDMNVIESGLAIEPTLRVPASAIGYEVYKVGTSAPVAVTRLETNARGGWGPGTYMLRYRGPTVIKGILRFFAEAPAGYETWQVLSWNSPGGSMLKNVVVDVVGTQVKPGEPIAYELLQPVTSIDLSIFDSAGRLVRSVTLTPGGALGIGYWTWDGRNNLGESVVPGHYHIGRAVLSVTTPVSQMPADEIVSFRVVHDEKLDTDVPTLPKRSGLGVWAALVGAAALLLGDN